MPHLSRLLALCIFVVLTSLALAACSPSVMTGGMTGGAIGLLLLGMLLAGSLTTQTGCDKRSGLGVHPCLSIAPPDYFDDQGNYVGPPDRRDMSEDAGKKSELAGDMAADAKSDDTKPALAPLLEDDMDTGLSPKKLEMHPCLSMTPREAYPDDPRYQTIDRLKVPEGRDPKDLEGGGLLEGIERQERVPADAIPVEEERERLLAKLADRLPADVLEKLES